MTLEARGTSATVRLLRTGRGWEAEVGGTAVMVSVDGGGATIDGLRSQPAVRRRQGHRLAG